MQACTLCRLYKISGMNYWLWIIFLKKGLTNEKNGCRKSRILDINSLQIFFLNKRKKGSLCDWKITQTPLKSRLFKFKSHPHGVFGVWHLLKSHYEKWVQKSPEALRHLGFLGWHLLRMHNMVAEMGFEPHDLRVMSPTSYQTAPLRDIMVPEAGVEPVREINLTGF